MAGRGSIRKKSGASAGIAVNTSSPKEKISNLSGTALIDQMPLDQLKALGKVWDVKPDGDHNKESSWKKPLKAFIEKNSKKVEAEVKNEEKKQPTKIYRHKDRLPRATDAEVFETIKALDKKLDTDNFLPIYHLREKLRKNLTRTQLNNALYRLEREDKIGLTSVVEATKYTNKQLNEGIDEPLGGKLFFIERYTDN